MPRFLGGPERFLSAGGVLRVFGALRVFSAGWLVIWGPDVTPNRESKRNRIAKRTFYLGEPRFDRRGCFWNRFCGRGCVVWSCFWEDSGLGSR